MTPYIYHGFWVSSNTALTSDQIFSNGYAIAKYFYRMGWTKECICAMLGNMRAESVMNPGNIENCPIEWADVFPDNAAMIASSFTAGLGLTQWTPGRDTLTPYADSIGFEWYDGNAQCNRLYYEWENNLNWVPVTVNGTYYTWNRFIQTSGDVNTVNELTEVFVRAYERPGEAAIIATLANRQYHAREWYNLDSVDIFSDFDLILTLLWYNKQKRKELGHTWKTI